MYTWNGMVKISYAEALYRFKSDLSVYLLYDDDTESLAEDESAIDEHCKNFGKFGYEKER